MNWDAGDIASVSSGSIALIGFVITIYNVLRSKKAAEHAYETAKKVREDIMWTDTVSELESTIHIMAEIKTLHRKGIWELLPDRYMALRKSLVLIRTANPNITHPNKTSLQNAAQHFANIERQVEIFLTNGAQPLDVAKLNTIVSKQIDIIQEILGEIRNQIGR